MKTSKTAIHDGHPIGRPFTSIPNSPSSLVNPKSSSTGSANDGAHAGTTPPATAGKRRVQPRDIADLAERLSDRDWQVLRSVAEHQFLTIRQVSALHFADHTPLSGPRIARRTLERLRGLRLLGTLHRRIGGVRAGSSGLVHYVDVVGDQLLRGRTGRRARRPHEPSARFRDHRLAIADVHVALVEASRESTLELLRCELEPTNWRRYVGMGGARLTLKPDLYAESAARPDSEFVDAWFIEIDLGTESIPTLLRKCHEYEAYRRLGIEQERSDGAFPVVVWSLTAKDPAKAERRRIALTDAIAADRVLNPALFRIVAPDQLIALIQKGGDQ